MIKYCLLLFLFFAHASIAELTLPMAKDFLKDAQRVKAQKIPILIMFSIPDCVYCEKIKEDILAPMAHMSEYKNKIIIRHIDANSANIVNNFYNKRVLHQDFAFQYAVNFFPTVILVDNYGVILSKIIGVANEEFYWTNLDEAISQASDKLHQRLNSKL